MTQNVHDALTIGIPTLAVLFGVLSTLLVNNRRFDKMDQRFDKMDQRFDRVDLKIDRVEAELTGRIDRVQAELTGRIDRVQADLSGFFKTLGEHDRNIDILNRKLDL